MVAWVRLTLLSLITTSHFQSAMQDGMVSPLKCYNDVHGASWSLCDEENGYSSCFTKYHKGKITGRGCSNKKNAPEEECEVHQSGEKVEEYCYCSYYLCNKNSGSSVAAGVSAGIVGLPLYISLLARLPI